MCFADISEYFKTKFSEIGKAYLFYCSLAVHELLNICCTITEESLIIYIESAQEINHALVTKMVSQITTTVSCGLGTTG
jgi:hypothetical protein